jgi:hypothetical protein
LRAPSFVQDAGHVVAGDPDRHVQARLTSLAVAPAAIRRRMDCSRSVSGARAVLHRAFHQFGCDGQLARGDPADGVDQGADGDALRQESAHADVERLSEMPGRSSALRTSTRPPLQTPDRVDTETSIAATGLVIATARHLDLRPGDGSRQLSSQVKEETVVIQSLMREERGGSVWAYRCLALFSAADGKEAGGISTIDLDPVRFESLVRLDRDPDVRRALARMFSLAMAGSRWFQRSSRVC